jgi:DDE family transposase
MIGFDYSRRALWRANLIQTIAKHFKTLQDPRMGNALQHVFLDILVITICALIRGADGWTQVEVWGRANAAWLRTFLELPSSIPSHDTFGRVFARLDPPQFRRCFLKWIRAISPTMARGMCHKLAQRPLLRSWAGTPWTPKADPGVGW